MHILFGALAEFESLRLKWCLATIFNQERPPLPPAHTHLSFTGSFEQRPFSVFTWFSEQGYCLKNSGRRVVCPCHPFACFLTVPRAVWDIIHGTMIKQPLHWFSGLCLAEEPKARRGRHADMLQHTQERRILGWKTLSCKFLGSECVLKLLPRKCRNQAIFKPVLTKHCQQVKVQSRKFFHSFFCLGKKTCWL